MNPEEVARRMTGSDIIDISGIDLKRFNLLSIKEKKSRWVEREDKRIDNKKNHQKKFQNCG